MSKQVACLIYCRMDVIAFLYFVPSCIEVSAIDSLVSQQEVLDIAWSWYVICCPQRPHTQ
jgi:hypothetical protein